MRRCTGILALALGVLGALTSGCARADLTQATRVPAPPTIDGKLDEAAWQTAPVSDPFKWLPSLQGKTELANTTFRLLADDQAVYLGVTCVEPKMADLKAPKVERDSPAVYSSDAVEIFLDPEGKGINYYQFAVNAGNSQYDSYWIEGGNTQGGQYNGIWDSAVFLDKGAWTLEVRLPLSAFYYTPSSAFAETWRINVCRDRQPEWQLSCWASLTNRFHDPQHFKRLSGMPRKASRFDLGLPRLETFIQQAAGGETYRGSVEIYTSAQPAAAGEYTLTLSDLAGKELSRKTFAVAAGDGKQTLAGVIFPGLGKRMLKAALTTKDNELVSGAYFPKELKYQPLVVDITEPFYARCIFPDERVTAITGTATVNLPTDAIKGATLAIAMSGPGVEQRQVKARIAEHTAEFSVEAADLQVGTYTLHCQVMSGEKVLAEQTLTVRKLGPAPGSSLRIDKYLRLLVNGTPTFARSWCGAGGAYMMSAALLKQFQGKPNSKFVNAWECQVGMEAERIDPKGEYDKLVKGGKPSQKIFDEMKTRIEANRTNQNLWWYYLCDEPECRGISPEYLKYQYDYIKELDPYRPVMIITRSPELYTECADILNPHPYLNPRNEPNGTRIMSSPKQIRANMRTVFDAGKRRIAGWCTPQAFSYGFTDPNNDYPTFAEYQCMVYTAIANGAQGLTPFMYPSHFGSVDLVLGNEYIYETLAALEPFLLNPQPPQAVKVTAPEDGVDAWTTTRDGKTLLIAVNLLNKPVDAEISSASFKNLKALVGFREKTKAAVTGGTVKLSFAPYEVHLLTSEKMDEKLKGLDAFTAELQKARDGLVKPGNILAGKGREIEWDASDTYISSRTLDSLTDGITDCYGWGDITRQGPPRIEMAFPTFVPKFRQAKLYTATVEDLEFWIWKAGEWQKIGDVKGNTKPVITLDFEQVWSTVKIKILMTKTQPGTKAELYEIELYGDEKNP